MSLRQWHTLPGVILALVLAGCDNTPHRRLMRTELKDRAAAVRSGLIAKGWVPDFLPETATNIIEWHNVEMDRSRVEFAFYVRESSWISNYFATVSDSRTNMLTHDVLASSGATVKLSGNVQYYELVRRAGDIGYMVINFDQGRAQYWSKAAR